MTHRWLVAGTCVLAFASHARAGVDPSGHLTQEVGLSVPDFHTIAPEIKLRYTSGARDGFVGVGWSLDAGARITRVSATHGIAHGDATDVYLLDGQELVPCAAASTSASCTTAVTAFGTSANYFSTKIESFERISHDTTLDYFTVWHRDGTRLMFFSNDNGNTYDLANVKDTHGNEVHYTQWCDVNWSSCYPDTITYATAGGLPGASIRFVREPRADKQVFANSGGFSTLAYRLHAVVVSMDGELLRVYQIHYDQSLSTGASIPTMIEQLGRDATAVGDVYTAGPTPALPAITMTADSLANQPTTENLNVTAPGLTADAATTTPYATHLPLVENQPLQVPYKVGYYSISNEEGDTDDRPHGQLVGDFDGDGLTDWVGWSVPVNTCASITTSSVRMTKRNHAPVVTHTNTGLMVTAGRYKQCPMQVYVTDIDGDGRDDLLVVSDTGLTPLMSNGAGSFTTGAAQAWSSGADECAVGDFDGDGRGDIACLAAVSATNTTVRLSVARSMQGGTWDIQTSDALGALGVWPIKTNLIAAGDFNGDGLVDLTVAQQIGTWTLLAGTSDGAGHFTWASQSTTWPASSVDETTLSTPDVDGDGKSDVVLIDRYPTGGNGVFVGRASKGATARYRLNQVTPAAWLRNAQLGDFDGDGKADLLLGDDQSWARGRGDGQFDAPTAATPVPDCAPSSMFDFDNYSFVADLNGDGRSDVLCVHDQHEVYFTLRDRMSPAVTIGAHHWIQADVTGDGIPELLYISHTNPGYHVVTVSTTDQTRIETDLPRSTELRDEDEPDTDRFIAMDVGSPGGGPDGKTDLVLVDNDFGVVRIYTFLSNGNGTFTLVLSKPGPTGSDSQAWRAASIDSDGLGDLIHPTWTGAGVHLDELRSRGDGTWEIPTAAPNNNYFAGSPELVGRDWFIADINGDGRSDLVHADGDAAGGNSVLRSLIGNGDGTFIERTSVNMTFFRDIRRVRIADINGDGLADLVHLAYTGPANAPKITMQSYLSTGTGTWGYQESNVAYVSSSPEDANIFEDLAFVRLMDVNGDGRSDFVHLSTYIDSSGQPRSALFTANNPGADQPPVWALGLTKGLAFANYDLDPWRWEQWTDRNGDSGLLYVHATQAQAYMFRPSRDRMTQFENGTGGTTKITYTPLVAQRTYLPENSLPVVVTSVEARDAVSGISEVTHYAYGEAQWSNVASQMGFGWTSERNASAIKLTKASVSDQCGPRPTSVQRMSFVGAMFAYTNYAYVNAGAAPYTCNSSVKDDYECEGGPTCRLARREQVMLDVYGNTVAKQVVADQAQASFVYRPVIANASSFITNLPAYEAHYDGTMASVLSMARFSYDGNAFPAGPSALGELREVEKFDSTASLFRATTLVYDSTGQLVQTTDPRLQSETVAYDARYGLYPTHTCAGALCRDLTIDAVSGQVTQIEDANKADTTMTYDGHGRLTSTQRPSGNATVIWYLDFGVTTGAQPQRVRTELTDGSSDGVLWSETQFDGFGRTYRTTREGGATIDTVYSDSSSRPQAVSNTYAAGQQPSAWTSFAYDVLGRVTSTTAPDNTQRQTSYLVGQTVGLDQQGHPKTAFTDGYGRVIRIDEQNFGTTGTTHYTYDAEGRLIAVTDALGHPTTVEYDMLGRKTATVDPDRGRIETTFLANGLVHESHDASGQVIRFDYDGIGRQILREDLDASNRVTRTATWQWDTDPSGTPSGASRGRLVSTTDSQVSTTITTANVYDADGRVTETQRCIDATCASTRASFDKAGRLASVTYPDATGGFGGNAETVPYTYDDAGELRSVGTYLRDADYEIDGAPAHLRYGNEVTTTLSYDPMRRWVNTITAAGSRGTLFDAAYSYDAVGRIHVAIETNPKTTQLGYTYDDLGRLVRVDGSNTARKENFAYDVIGRMKSSGATGDLHYDDPLHVHAPTGADIGYARNYDTNGNTTTIRNPSGRRLGLTWNVDNTLASITDGNVTSQLAYDTDGTRVKRVTAAGTSLYFGPLVEIVNGRQLRYYYAGERLIARRDAGDVMYYTRDLAHSTRVVSDPNGKAADRYEYSAFGGVYSRSESVPQDQEQGGGRHDDDSDLTYMRARYYDPGLMHFLSADTIVPNVRDPRSFHRYAYTQQDPINFWDPSGHMPMRVSWRKDAIAHSSFAWMAAQGGFACSGGDFCLAIPAEQEQEVLVDSHFAALMQRAQAQAQRDAKSSEQVGTELSDAANAAGAGARAGAASSADDLAPSDETPQSDPDEIMRTPFDPAPSSNPNRIDPLAPPALVLQGDLTKADVVNAITGVVDTAIAVGKKVAIDGIDVKIGPLSGKITFGIQGDFVDPKLMQTRGPDVFKPDPQLVHARDMTGFDNVFKFPSASVPVHGLTFTLTF